MSQDQTPDQGDLDILNYWNAAVLNYKRCHDKPEEYDTVPKITKDMMDMIPKTMEAMTKAENDKADEQFKNAPVENANHQEEEQYQDEGGEEEEEEEEEYQDHEKEEEDGYQEEEEEYQYQEGDDYQQEYNDPFENEEEVRSPFKRPINEYSDGSKQAKKKRKEKIYPMNNEHNDYSYYQMPSAAPPPAPPAPPVPGQDEALSNLIMAWYYSGYYTGLYQAQQQHKQ